MSIPCAQVEVILIARAGKRMTFVGMDGSTVDGSNLDLVDPMVSTLISMGVTPASYAGVVDADLATLEDIPQFLDRCELRLLQNILGNMDMVTNRVGPRSENLSDFSDALEKAITRKQEQIQKEYGAGVGTLSAGVINLGFMETDEDA